MASVGTFDASTYSDALTELTFNSKLHITNLTIIAQENINSCKEIVQEIEKRIQTAPVPMKLPVLYLLDSIIKNIGEPYITQFGINLVTTFCSTYEAVKDDVRASMVRLLKTWPQFFPAEQIHVIESRIQQITLSSRPPIIPRPDGRNIHVNPNLFRGPTTSVNRTTPELIKELEDALKRTDPLVLAQPQIAQQLSAIQKQLSVYMARTNTRSTSPILNKLPSSGALTSVSPPPQSAPSTNPSDLVNTLLSMGLLGANKEQTVVNSSQQPSSIGNSLRLPAVRKLYDSFTLQCSNCGLRFNDQNELSTHLDNHFAISSRKSKNKVLSRKWHQAEDEWIKQVDEIVVESPGAIFFSQLNEPVAEKDESATSAVNVEEGVPVDQDQTQCPVCHEKFELGRDSNTDEWIYKDTIRDSASNVIAHRLCMPSYLNRQKDLNIVPV